MPQPRSFELLASATQVSSGSGGSVDITVTDDVAVTAIRRALRVTVDVTAFVEVDMDPVPAVVYTLETRASSSAPWRSAGTVSASDVGVYELAAGGLDALVRVSWAFTNITSATFSATSIAYLTYCDPLDITRYSVPERSIEDVDASTRADACISASDVADGYLNSSFVMPISAWSDDLREMTAHLAAATVFRRRGADPEGPDALVFDAENKALKWLARIADGKLKPVGIVDATPDTFEGGSFVVEGRPRRGW